MKKLTGISLFIFFSVVTSILIVGLLFYQINKKSGKVEVKNASTTLAELASSGVTSLSLAEVSRHNTVADCWMVINGNVYNLSGYASSHPGGTRNIANYCGKEATQAFATKGGQGDPHSASANRMLSDYLLGTLNQKLSQATLEKTIKQTNSALVSSNGKANDDREDN